MFEPSIWGRNPQGWKQIYLDKYSLWTQLVGCILLFSPPFLFLANFHHHIPFISGILGAILCTINWAVDPM